MDKDTTDKPININPLEGAFKSPEQMAVKDINVEHVNILHKVKITYKTPQGRTNAIEEAMRVAKRSTKRYGGDDSYTMNIEESEHVITVAKR